MEAFLKISAIQSNLVWEDIDANLSAFENKINSLTSKSDLIVLPEMFSTGFSMNPNRCAEKPNGKTTLWMQKMARHANSVITGSIVIEENGKYFNRLIWMKPNGNYETYDKKHLFSIAGENEIYTAGTDKLIIELKGWKICPLICYDLRFPVWCKNKYIRNEFEYDLLIFVANWPEIRSHAWNTLLAARAIENMSYLVGVNRVGDDGNKISHSGNTQIIDPKGMIISKPIEGEESVCQATLDAAVLKNFRNQFAVGDDWDQFRIIDNSVE
jgi:omega-amidase